MFNIDNIVRSNIKELTPYSSARSEYQDSANIWLDANENPEESSWNRYPDPHQAALKKVISAIKGPTPDQMLIGNGSDEIIDLLFRAFCDPSTDKAYVFQPTYGMYEVMAKINNVELVAFALSKTFELPPIKSMLGKLTTKGLLFICSPNNPTGNCFSLESIKEISAHFRGLVVVDEAYIDFSTSKSAISLLKSIPNLVVLQTLSKAYGLAALRIGIAFANTELITVLQKIKPPYNVSTANQQHALKSLENNLEVKKLVKQNQEQRTLLAHALKQLPWVNKIYPSQANFILVVFINATLVYRHLTNKGIIVRNRSKQIKNALRITVGTPMQNEQLIQTLKELST